MNLHLFVCCLLLFSCSDLYGIDMNNPSLAEQSSGNGHVSLSGKCITMQISFSVLYFFYLTLGGKDLGKITYCK